jgi:hypothetical protein
MTPQPPQLHGRPLAPSAAMTSPQGGAAATHAPRPRSRRTIVDRPHRSGPRSATCPCELPRPTPPLPHEGGRKLRHRWHPRALPGDAHWRRRGGEEGEGGSSGRRRQEAPVAHRSNAEPRVFFTWTLKQSSCPFPPAVPPELFSLKFLRPGSYTPRSHAIYRFA